MIARLDIVKVDLRGLIIGSLKKKLGFGCRVPLIYLADVASSGGPVSRWAHGLWYLHQIQKVVKHAYKQYLEKVTRQGFQLRA